MAGPGAWSHLPVAAEGVDACQAAGNELAGRPVEAEAGAQAAAKWADRCQGQTAVVVVGRLLGDTRGVTAGADVLATEGNGCAVG